ncbi:hypothetical protein P7C73_g1887, partial [Tremellales sp. Uapishka_1]
MSTPSAAGVSSSHNTSSASRLPQKRPAESPLSGPGLPSASRPSTSSGIQVASSGSNPLVSSSRNPLSKTSPLPKRPRMEPERPANRPPTPASPATPVNQTMPQSISALSVQCDRITRALSQVLTSQIKLETKIGQLEARMTDGLKEQRARTGEITTLIRKLDSLNAKVVNHQAEMAEIKTLFPSFDRLRNTIADDFRDYRAEVAEIKALVQAQRPVGPTARFAALGAESQSQLPSFPSHLETPQPRSAVPVETSQSPLLTQVRKQAESTSQSVDPNSNLPDVTMADDGDGNTAQPEPGMADGVDGNGTEYEDASESAGEPMERRDGNDEFEHELDDGKVRPPLMERYPSSTVEEEKQIRAAGNSRDKRQQDASRGKGAKAREEMRAGSAHPASPRDDPIDAALAVFEKAREEALAVFEKEKAREEERNRELRAEPIPKGVEEGDGLQPAEKSSSKAVETNGNGHSLRNTSPSIGQDPSASFVSPAGDSSTRATPTSAPSSRKRRARQLETLVTSLHTLAKAPRRSSGTPSKPPTGKSLPSQKKEAIESEGSVGLLAKSDGVPRGQGKWPSKASMSDKGKTSNVILKASAPNLSLLRARGKLTAHRAHWACAGFTQDETREDDHWMCPDCAALEAGRRSSRHTPMDVAPADRCIRYNCILRERRARPKEEDSIWTVKKIIGRRCVGRAAPEKKGDLGKRVFQYLILWEGFALEDATWEPEVNVNDHDINEYIEEAKGLALDLARRVTLLDEAKGICDEKGNLVSALKKK